MFECSPDSTLLFEKATESCCKDVHLVTLLGPRHSMVCCGEDTEMEVDIAMKLRGAMIAHESQKKKPNHIHLFVIAITSIPPFFVFLADQSSCQVLERLDLSFGSTDVFVLHLQLLRGWAGARFRA